MKKGTIIDALRKILLYILVSIIIGVYVIGTVLLILGLIVTVVRKENTIKSIDMTVYINNSGDATITEIWNTYPIDGTEYYHSYYNLGNSTIKNLKVSDESGEYKTQPSWNPSDSFNDKTNKCGLNFVSGGIEICWGKGVLYENKTYTVEYEITNFVKSLTDAQMAYWTLIPEGHDKFGKVNIEIKSDFAYGDTIEVRGYGNYGGICEVSDGIIKMNSKGKKFPSEDYMVILIKFPSETFDTNNIENKNYEHYLDMEEAAAIHYNESKIKKIISISVMGIILVILLAILFVCIIVSIILKNLRADNNSLSKKDKKKIKKAEYYRDIPCKDDLFKTYYIALKSGLIENKTDFFGAVLLKWQKEKIINVRKIYNEEKQEDEECIQLNLTDKQINAFTFSQKYEEKLYKYINAAAESNNEEILEKDEFNSWCETHYSDILNWFDEIIEDKMDELKKSGDIGEKIYSKTFGIKRLAYSEKLFNKALQLSGLKNYLKNYTLIHEREAIEVELFEDYLIYAQMFGIAKKVMNNFKNLYPEEIAQTNFESFADISSLNIFASSAMNYAAYKNYLSSHPSYGGGSSSGGRWRFIRRRFIRWFIRWWRPEWAVDKNTNNICKPII